MKNLKYEMTIEQLRTQCESQIKSYENDIMRLRADIFRLTEVINLNGKVEMLKTVLWWTRPKDSGK